MDETGAVRSGGRVPGIEIFLPFLVLIYAPYQFIVYPPTGQVEWYSVISEGVVTLFLFKALLLTAKIYHEKGLYWPLFFGFSALLFSGVTDVLDEFLRQPEWVTVLFEDMLQLVGYPLVVLGLYRWVMINQHMHEDLQRQAVTDYLTGTLNRRGFMEQYQKEVTRSKRYGSGLSMVWFDLDQFKQINDRFGHHTGDEVLRAIAELAGKHLRKVDILGRMGGEEFCVLMPSTHVEGAIEAAEKLRIAFSEYHCPDVGVVTASFGVGEYRPGESGEALLNRVDDALYRAKRTGRDQVVLEQ